MCTCHTGNIAGFGGDLANPAPIFRRGVQHEGWSGMRIERIVSLVAVLALLAAAPVWAATGQGRSSETTQQTEVKVSPRPAALAAKRRLDSEANAPWRVEWNPKTGVVEEISGQWDRSFGDSPKAAATAFLQEYGALFTGRDSTGEGYLSEFRYQRMSNKNPRRTTVKFLQYYKDIPVEAGVAVYVDKGGQVTGARSGAIHISDLSVTPTIGVEEAIELLRQRVAPKRLSASPDLCQGLRVVGHTDQPRLVYMIHAVSVEQCGPYTAYLDAHSGEVVSFTQDWADGPRDCDPFSNFDTQPAPRPEPEIETPDERADSSESLFVPPPRGEIYFNPLRPRDSGKGPIYLPKFFDPYRPRIERSSPPGSRGDPPDTTRSPAELDNQVVNPRGRASSNPATTSFIFADHSLSDRDWDLDGYEQWCYLDWTVETTEPSIQVQVDIFGRDEWGGVDFLRQSEYTTVVAGTPMSDWIDVPVPYHSRWDFRIELWDWDNNMVDALDYGVTPGGTGNTSDIPLERVQDDALVVQFYGGSPTVAVIPLWDDLDNDGFWAEPFPGFNFDLLYDSTYDLIFEYFMRDENDVEYSLGEVSFTASHGASATALEINPFPEMHGLWDFRVDIRADPCIGQCLLTSVSYQDSAQGWIDFPLERWDEDVTQSIVFQPNPIHSLNDPSLYDMNDALDATPWGRRDSAYFRVTLDSLHPSSTGLDSLTGAYAMVVDFPDGFFGTEAGYLYRGRPHIEAPTSPDGRFSYLRDSAGFEAVMCYHYITEVQIYVQTLGFDSACNRQIWVDAHGYDGADQAAYLPKRPTPGYGFGYLVFGDGGTDAAEDAEAIIHEYGHAITDNIAPQLFYLPDSLTPPVDETGAMREGFCDYWACSWSDSFYPGPVSCRQLFRLGCAWLLYRSRLCSASEYHEGLWGHNRRVLRRF